MSALRDAKRRRLKSRRAEMTAHAMERDGELFGNCVYLRCPSTGTERWFRLADLIGARENVPVWAWQVMWAPL